MTQHIWDAIIVGGGPAGLSAAQALGRSLRSTLVIDAGEPRNRFAAHMHNVLGHDGVPPGDLNAMGRSEAKSYGVEFREGAVLSVRDEGRVLSLEVAQPGERGEPGARSAGDDDPGAGERIVARQLIVATGVADELPAIPGLAEHWGRGVYHCPYCHGWEVRGRRIAVVALSPLGMHQVKLLRQWTDRLVAFTAGIGEIDAATALALEARGVVCEPDPVAEIIGDGSGVTAVRTESGVEHAVDAVFTMGSLVPHDGFLAGLQLERAENLAGSFVAVDPVGRTSHSRVWAVGNVANPMASVPMSAAAGNFTGGAVNAALVEEDFELAAAAPHDPEAPQDAAQFWEQRYAESDRIWSGRVNPALADIVNGWDPGRSLDLGCGEGGDVLWLAERGWEASGIDLSTTAVARGRREAEARGIPNAAFVAADLGEWADRGSEIDGSSEPFDLISASFMQSPVELPRERILRAATARLAPGGRLVVVSHAAAPPWASEAHGPHGAHGPHDFPQPESELAALDLDPESWEIVTAEVRTREASGPDGAPATLDDTVVVVRRR
ncbi:MAG: FAD-dependent oxidoreductase [Leucobacter sp.]